MHFKDKKTKSMSWRTVWNHCDTEFSPPVNNDAIKLSSELIYLFILGMFNHLRISEFIIPALRLECAYRSSEQAKVIYLLIRL